MKLTKALCAALAVVFMLAAVGLAVEEPAEKPRGPRGPRPGPAGEGMLQHLTKALDLTEAQQAQIKEILQAQRQATEKWREEHADELKKLREEMREAREKNDAEAMKATAEKMRELHKGRMEAAGNEREKIAAVLNDDQKDKFKKMAVRGGWYVQAGPLRRPGAQGMLGSLNQLDLTDEQKAQVKDILKAAHEEAAKAEDPKAKAKIMAEAFEKIRDTVLTDEQRKKLAKIRRRFVLHHPGLQRLINLAQALELTDEQKAEIKETLEAARKKIHDEVLTDEQRAKLKELRENPPKRPPPPPHKPGKGGPRGYGPYQKPEKED